MGESNNSVVDRGTRPMMPPWDLQISCGLPRLGLSVTLEMASTLFSLLLSPCWCLPELWNVVDVTKLLINLISGKLECFLRSNYSRYDWTETPIFTFWNFLTRERRGLELVSLESSFSREDSGNSYVGSEEVSALPQTGFVPVVEQRPRRDCTSVLL